MIIVVIIVIYLFKTQYNEELSCRRDRAGRRSLRRSRSFVVIDFGTNRKPVCDFILVINANLHPIFSPFPSYCRLLVKFVLSTGGPVFNALIRDEPLNSGPRNLASRNQKHHSIVRCKMCFSIFNRLRSGTSVTDERTDGLTDRC